MRCFAKISFSRHFSELFILKNFPFIEVFYTRVEHSVTIIDMSFVLQDEFYLDCGDTMLITVAHVVRLAILIFASRPCWCFSKILVGLNQRWAQDRTVRSSCILFCPVLQDRTEIKFCSVLQDRTGEKQWSGRTGQAKGGKVAGQDRTEQVKNRGIAKRDTMKISVLSVLEVFLDDLL